MSGEYCEACGSHEDDLGRCLCADKSYEKTLAKVRGRIAVLERIIEVDPTKPLPDDRRELAEMQILRRELKKRIKLAARID